MTWRRLYMSTWPQNSHRTENGCTLGSIQTPRGGRSITSAERNSFVAKLALYPEKTAIATSCCCGSESERQILFNPPVPIR